MHPCGGEKKKKGLLGNPVAVTPVTKIKTPEQLLRHAYPAFGGAFVRRIFMILDQIIGRGVPLIVAVAGPVTASNQHRAWLIPLIEAGWVAYLSTTDAVCYHDGHDSLQRFTERPLREVPISGHDLELRKQEIIRITDIGFKEKILLDQDRMLTAMLMQPEFQRKMTGTEFRNLMGKYYDAQERKHRIPSGLLSTCWKNDIPVFVGAPGDGSAFLNATKLWTLKQLGEIDFRFELDIPAEVFESCAYHFWGLTSSPAKQLGILILGGGVPKNFALQPEPTLSQIFMLSDIGGYDYDVQIVGAPVSDGSLTGCLGQEAHTWGKVSEEALQAGVEGLQADYSTIMPLISWALVEKRERFRRLKHRLGWKKLLEKHPEAAGYLRREGGFRLFSKRELMVAELLKEIGKPEQLSLIKGTLDFPLAILDDFAS